jgi:hypothetical protein
MTGEGEELRVDNEENQELQEFHLGSTICIWFEGTRRCSWHEMWPADERTQIFIFLAQMMIAELFSRHFSSEKCNLRNSQAEDFL